MSDEKRNEIIAGVWGVIADQGLAGVSFRSVAAEAGVSVGRVQHYFGSKVDLVRSSVEAMVAGAAEANPQALEDPTDPATLDSLLKHASDTVASSRAGASVYYAFVAASITDPWIAATLAQAKRGQIDRVGDCLEAQAPGLSNRQATAVSLVTLADGVTQGVYLGYLTHAQANSTIDAATMLVRKTAGEIPSGVVDVRFSPEVGCGEAS